MRRPHLLIALGVISLAALLALGTALAQMPPPPPPDHDGGPGAMPGPGPRDMQDGNPGLPPDPQKMEQALLDRIQQHLQAGDEQWKTYKPLIEKIRTLMRELNTPGAPGPIDRGPGTPDTTASSDRATGPVTTAARSLRAAVTAQDPNLDTIKRQLATLRRARLAVENQLEEARTTLLELVTPRQEATLVLLGILE